MLTYHFVPSARTASSVDEFLIVCDAERAVAATHLQQGYFEPWLRDTGRADLAAAAAEVRGAAGPPDAALERFLRAALAPRGKAPRKTRSATIARARAA